MNKKIKLLILLTSIIIVLFIYKATYNKKYNYLALGDGISIGVNSFGVEDYSYADYLKDLLEKRGIIRYYNKSFSERGYLISNMLNDLNTNKTIELDGKKLSIRSSLREANLVTISIGSNDFLKLFNYSLNDFMMDKIKNDKVYYLKEIDKIFINYEKLLKEIRKYAKGKIILIGYYNPVLYDDNYKELMDYIVKYSNNKLQDLADDCNIDFVNIYSVLNDKNYFSNPSSMYLNKEGYREISSLIVKNCQIFLKMSVKIDDGCLTPKGNFWSFNIISIIV